MDDPEDELDDDAEAEEERAEDLAHILEHLSLAANFWPPDVTLIAAGGTTIYLIDTRIEPNPQLPVNPAAILATIRIPNTAGGQDQ